MNFDFDLIDTVSQAIKVLSSDCCTYSSIVKFSNILINSIFKVLIILFLLLSSFGARIKEFVVATNSLKMRTRLSRNHLRFFLSTDVWAYAGTCDNFYIINPFFQPIEILQFCLVCDCNSYNAEDRNFVILAYARKNLRWYRF